MLIYTKHGLLGGKNGYISYGQDSYSVVRNPSLCPCCLQEIKGMVTSKEFNIEESKAKECLVVVARVFDIKDN